MIQQNAGGWYTYVGLSGPTTGCSFSRDLASRSWNITSPVVNSSFVCGLLARQVSSVFVQQQILVFEPEANVTHAAIATVATGKGVLLRPLCLALPDVAFSPSRFCCRCDIVIKR